jgi:hypothetical protein
MNEIADKDILIKQYDILVCAHTQWLELILKYNTAYYVITGAILSFYLSRADVRALRLSLLLPLFIGIGLMTFAFQCAHLMDEVERELDGLQAALNLGVTPKAVFIKRLLFWSGIFFGTTAAALTILQFVDLSFLVKKN